MGLAAAEPVLTPAGVPVPYDVDRTHYNNFVKNWNFTETHLVTAHITSPEQYRKVFNPAALMWQTNVFEPKPELYDTKSIILVARDFKDAVEKPFEVTSITEKDGVLGFYYTLHAGSVLGDGIMHLARCNSAESKLHPGKRWISVVVPRSKINKVIFVENNIEVGKLNIATGPWISPTSPYLHPDGER